MATIFEHGAERRSFEVETGGSLVEAVGGLGVVVLTILGLSSLNPHLLAAIAGIVFGVALLAEGATVASEFSTLYSKITGAADTIEFGGGMTIEIAAGVGSVVLGILALSGQAPGVLLPALIIGAGGTLILTTAAKQRLNHLKMEAASVPDMAQRVAHASSTGVSATQLLAGLTAVVLGILSLVALAPAGVGAASAMTGAAMPLTLTGLLVLGIAMMMTGGTLTGRFLQMFSHEDKQRPMT